MNLYDVDAPMDNKADIIAKVCDRLSRRDHAGASAVIVQDYPFAPSEANRPAVSKETMMRVFLRDGFVDQYSGTRLVFPLTLRLISDALPNEFPFHPNWKMSASHIAYWDLYATIDHIVPVARGGTSDETNLVCCSMLTNARKANWTLQELGWARVPTDDPRRWDGLVPWFSAQTRERPEIRERSYCKPWLGVLDRLAKDSDAC